MKRRELLKGLAAGAVVMVTTQAARAEEQVPAE